MWLTVVTVWLLGVSLVWPLLYAYGERDARDWRTPEQQDGADQTME